MKSSQPKIFITPWIDLNAKDIDKCFQAGADSARIHTGKLQAPKINELIAYYSSRKHKFYLDLTGNKPRVQEIIHCNNHQECEIGDLVLFTTKNSTKAPGKFEHQISSDFFPEALKETDSGDLNMDDGNLSFQIEKIVKNKTQIDYIITRVVHNQEKYVFPRDGISSKNITMHSRHKNVLTVSDLEILTNIPKNLRSKINRIVISFCETKTHIIQAEQQIRAIGYQNFMLVPKVETVLGIQNLNQICLALKLLYCPKAELQIGRGDLSQDSMRGENTYDYRKLVDQAITIAQRHRVKIAILALTLRSSKEKFRSNRQTTDLAPSAADIAGIQHLCKANIDQIGLTNDMYLDQPERIVRILREVIEGSKNIRI
ncbi:MAG: hypothetical protein WCJ58_07235 [bacterium]